MGYSAKQRKVKVQVEGLEKIKKTLESMGDAAGSVLMKGAKVGGEVALEDAKRNCPVDTGALKQSLHLTEDKKTAKKATIKVDYDKKLKYGTFVELGTATKPGNPFLRNAVDKNQAEINQKIVEVISKEIGAKI